MRSRGRNGVEERGFLSRHMLLASSGVWMLIAILTGRRRGRTRVARPAAATSLSVNPQSIQSPVAHSSTGPTAPSARTAQRGWLGDPRRCVTADCLLIVLAIAAAAVCLLEAPHAARLLLLLAACCLLPGSALLTLLPTEDELEAAALAVGLGFTIEAVGALAMIWTGWWHPFGWAIVLGVSACAMLALDAFRNAALAKAAR